MDKQRRQRHCWERYSSSAGDRQRVHAIRKGFRKRFAIRSDVLFRLACAVCMNSEKRKGCRTYADSATAQTRPNEATELGVRSVQTYPALWLLLFLFVGVRCRHRLLRHSIRETQSVSGVGRCCVYVYVLRLYARLLCVRAPPAARAESDMGSDRPTESSERGKHTPARDGTWHSHVARQGMTDN